MDAGALAGVAAVLCTGFRTPPSSSAQDCDIAETQAGGIPIGFLAAKGAGLVVLAAIGMLVGAHKPVLLILYAAVGGVIGFFLPDVLLYNSGIKRQARIQAALPDAMDMLTICVEAGLRV